MSPEALKATLIAKALHQMANASANLQVNAARMMAYPQQAHEYERSNADWQGRYEEAIDSLNDLLDPLS